MNINQFIIKELAKKTFLLKSNVSFEHLAKIKRKASRKYNLPCPTNIELLKTYRQLIQDDKIKLNKIVEKTLITKNIRTSSGVAIIAVLTKPYPCPGKCVYCPNEKNMPKSYLSNEPAVMRAILTDFHPYKQVQARIGSLEVTGHKTDKIELIVMGGTFSYLPKQYQTWFVKECFRACEGQTVQELKKPAKLSFPRRRESSKQAVCFANWIPVFTGMTVLGQSGAGGISGQYIAKYTLEDLQKLNEKSQHRIVGLTLETRPDYIDEKEIINMRKLGATRVELGVQNIYDDVLKLNKRGHGRAEIIRATKLLKEAGFKINYHMMPNLPGSNYKKDLEMFKELFSNPNFQPDMLKIYPCVVVKNSQIYKWWREGKYKPYSDKKLMRLLCEIKKTIPYYVRITRLVRDIPATSIIAGNKISNLRQVLEKKSEKESWQCKCIRCREIRNEYGGRDNRFPHDRGGRGVGNAYLKLFRQDYNASGGKEIFLSFEDKDRKYLYSLLRLRINKIKTRYPEISLAKLSKNTNLISFCHSRESGNPVNLSSRGVGDKQNFYILDSRSESGMTVVGQSKSILPVLQNAAIIREVHTYGQLVPINSKNKKSPQHTGLGKKLIAEAERIAREEFNLKKIAVISGVGVRDYYRKLGYLQKNTYMIKYLERRD